MFGSTSDYGTALKVFKNMWGYGKDTDPQGQFEESYSEMDIASLASPDSRLCRPVWEHGVGMFSHVRIMAATDVFLRTLATRVELRLMAAMILAEPTARRAYRVDEASAGSVQAWMDHFVAKAPSFHVSLARRHGRRRSPRSSPDSPGRSRAGGAGRCSATLCCRSLRS